MTIVVAATLEAMTDIYRRSAKGGVRSERFTAYTAAASRGTPIQGYNPMTSLPVLASLAGLREASAEERLARVANRIAASLGHRADEVMHLSVATPGLWTDRLATGIEHRLLMSDPAGVLWRFDDPPEPARLDAAIIAQTVRMIAARRHGPPVTLADAVRREGLAAAIGGSAGRADAAAAEALDLLAEDTSLATKVAFLDGDDAARAMGYAALGLDEGAGHAHATFLARTSGEPGAAFSPPSRA